MANEHLLFYGVVNGKTGKGILKHRRSVYLIFKIMGKLPRRGTGHEEHQSRKERELRQQRAYFLSVQTGQILKVNVFKSKKKPA